MSENVIDVYMIDLFIELQVRQAEELARAKVDRKELEEKVQAFQDKLKRQQKELETATKECESLTRETNKKAQLLVEEKAENEVNISFQSKYM